MNKVIYCQERRAGGWSCGPVRTTQRRPVAHTCGNRADPATLSGWWESRGHQTLWIFGLLDKDPCAAPDCADGIRETQRIIYAIVVAKDVAHERGTARRQTAGYVTQGNKWLIY